MDSAQQNFINLPSSLWPGSITILIFYYVGINSRSPAIARQELLNHYVKINAKELNYT